MNELTKREAAEAKMLTRMQQGAFTFMDLWRLDGGDGEGPEYRWADALIQRERKAGRIHQIKRGVWLIAALAPGKGGGE